MSEFRARKSLGIVGLDGWSAIAILTIAMMIWRVGVTGTLNVLEPVWWVMLIWTALALGRAVAKGLGSDKVSRRSLVVELLTGQIVTALALFVGKIIIPVPLPLMLVGLAILAFLLNVFMSRFHAGSESTDRDGMEVVAVALCAITATLWAWHLFPERFQRDGYVDSVVFIEYHGHNVNCLPILSPWTTTVQYGSPHFAGKSWSFYHLASYTYSATITGLGSISGVQSLAGIWFPFGVVTIGLAAYLLVGTVFGRRHGFWGIALVVLAPDPTFWSWKSIPFSFWLVVEANPGVAGGIVVGAVTLHYLIHGLRSQHLAMTLLGLALSLCCLFFRSSFLFAVVPACLLLLALWGIRPGNGWHRRVLLVYLAVLGVGFIAGKQLRGAPSTAINLRGGEPFADWSTMMLPEDDGLLSLVPAPGEEPIATSLVKRTLYFLIGGFQGGLYVFLATWLAAWLVWRSPVEVLIFPIASIAVFLGVALLLVPNVNGDPYELHHRPFTWYYALLAAWVGGQWGRGLDYARIPSRPLSLLACVLLMVPAGWVGAQRNIPYMQVEHELPNGYLDAVAFLKQTLAPTERFLDSEKDPILVTTGLVERPAFVCWKDDFTFPGQGKLRLDRLERLSEADALVAAVTEEAIVDWHRRHGINWVLVHPQSPLAWPDRMAREPVFESGGYRVFDLRLLVPSGVRDGLSLERHSGWYDPNMATSDVIRAHDHAGQHRAEILASEQCGCFYCCRMFEPEAIKTWIDDRDGVGQTALCPRCGIDSVIGSQSGYPITADFLDAMKTEWFLRPP